MHHKGLALLIVLAIFIIGISIWASGLSSIKSINFLPTFLRPSTYFRTPFRVYPYSTQQQPYLYQPNTPNQTFPAN